MFKKLMAAAIATAMTASLAACGDAKPADASSESKSDTAKTEESKSDAASTEVASSDVEMTTVLIDPATGKPYDLGGMEIIIRDWWSSEPGEAKDDYEEALYAYRDWIQETYNFTIKQQAISDWGSTPQDFVDYATTGGDENYVFILRDDAITTGAMAQGLMYDLSTLDCLDFSEKKFQQNLLHKQYGKGDAIYAMYAGVSEPRTGMYFNKKLLKEAGIDPESLYELQASGQWTWDKWVELMKQVQRDIDADGVIDVWGTTQNNGSVISATIYSNGGSYIGKDAQGNFTYDLENAETQQALEFWIGILNDYTLPYPEGAQWDYYKEAFVNGMAAFMPEDGYAGTPGSFLENMEDDFGFVMYPKGPQMSDYINCWSNNPAAIPACYSAEKAWKIAFAWNLYTNDTPGYEDYAGWKTNYYAGFRDTRSVDETAEMMTQKGMIAYVGVCPKVNLGPDFAWGISAGCDLAAQVEKIRDTWKGYIAEANAQ